MRAQFYRERLTSPLSRRLSTHRHPLALSANERARTNASEGFVSSAYCIRRVSLIPVFFFSICAHSPLTFGQFPEPLNLLTAPRQSHPRKLVNELSFLVSVFFIYRVFQGGIRNANETKSILLLRRFHAYYLFVRVEKKNVTVADFTKKKERRWSGTLY